MARVKNRSAVSHGYVNDVAFFLFAAGWIVVVFANSGVISTC